MSKKGFTLIELLAVIVILAVISLITIPLIMGVIEESKVGAFKDSVMLSFSSAELYEARVEVITTAGINVVDLDIKNNNFKYGKIIKNANNDLEVVNVSDGNYCANGVLTNITVYDGECDPDAPICTYTVTSGTLGLNNYYTNSPTIEFVTSVSKSSGLYYGVGFVENYETIMLNEGQSKTETSTITTNTDGITINGYVKSGAGKTGTCSVNLKIDTNSPTVSTNVSGKDATITLGDNLGINGYAITTSATAPTVWTSETGTNKVEAYTATTAGTYYAWVRDQAGNTVSSSFVIPTTAFCAYTAGNYWNFAYNGGIQTFTAPCSGTYKLEVWGAQGGTALTGIGGAGGYSKGNVVLSAANNLYVVVGGVGVFANNASYSNGGYNGGGRGGSNNTNDYYGSSGGGATHIATTSGILSSLASNTSSILIVAGGGGGGARQDSSCTGGTGGGTTGGAASGGNYNSATGGSQITGGKGYDIYTIDAGRSGYFGQGGNATSVNVTGGGGGGYYGGGAAYYGSGGGGSGYLSSVLTSTSMTNGVRSGSGYATITLVSIN